MRAGIYFRPVSTALSNDLQHVLGSLIPSASKHSPTQNAGTGIIHEGLSRCLWLRSRRLAPAMQGPLPPYSHSAPPQTLSTLGSYCFKDKIQSKDCRQTGVGGLLQCTGHQAMPFSHTAVGPRSRGVKTSNMKFKQKGSRSWDTARFGTWRNKTIWSKSSPVTSLTERCLVTLYSEQGILLQDKIHHKKFQHHQVASQSEFLILSVHSD